MMNESNETEDRFNCILSNLSSSNITNESFWRIPEETRIGAIVIGVFLVIMCVIGVVWNSFIIITFFTKRKLLKEPANIFLLNVAITDLLTCLTTMVFNFVTAFVQEFRFGENDVTRCAVCNMAGFFLSFLILLSLHLLMALSIDRFILLSRPLHYKRLMNRWKAILICVICYVVCFILAILPIIGFGEIEFNFTLGTCVQRFTPESNLYYVVVLACEALIPITILAVTNVWTFKIVSQVLKRNFRRRSTYGRKDAESAKQEGHKHHRQQKQLVKVFGALFIANIVSYSPTIIAIFLSLIFVDQFPPVVFIIGFVSFLTNPVLHPIIESCFVKELRYQVNRAKQGVRRVSTVIIRQTTQLFKERTLDEAHRKMNDDSTPTPKKKIIRFLDGRVVESVVTETEDINLSSRSQTPEPPHKIVVNGTTRDAPANRPALSKERRSVTFDNHNNVLDVDRPRAKSSPVAASPTTIQKLESCLKASPQPPPVEGEEVVEEQQEEHKKEVEVEVERPRPVSMPVRNDMHASSNSLGFEMQPAPQPRVIVEVRGSSLDRTLSNDHNGDLRWQPPPRVPSETTL